MSTVLKVEHLVLRTLAKISGRRERWLLAVSGGVDSIAMAEILCRWRRHLKVEIVIAHVHHGHGENREQNHYRDRAQECVSDWAARRGVEFVTNEATAEVGGSEGNLRDFRRGLLKSWLRRGDFDRLVFAHHLDDLLETRLLRLIRGSGPQGLKAMSSTRGRVVRPLLSVARRDIEQYARARELTWVEDPSNQSKESSLRNWLRLEWLPQLERRSPGATNSLSRSLSMVASDKFTETIGPFVGLRRASLSEAEPSQRAAIVARYLRSVGINGYSRNHVDEVLKRLDRTQPARFDMLGFSFQATPDFLWASRV